MLSSCSQGGKKQPLLPAPLFIFLLELLGFTLKLKLTHNFVLYLFIVTGKSLLSSNLRSLEWRQIQNHSSGNSSGDNGFRNSALEVKAELLIAALEYLQVWPKGESKYFGTVRWFCITWNMNWWRGIWIGLMNTTSCMFPLPNGSWWRNSVDFDYAWLFWVENCMNFFKVSASTWWLKV